MVKPGGVTEGEVEEEEEGDGDDLSRREDGGEYESVMMHSLHDRLGTGVFFFFP